MKELFLLGAGASKEAKIPIATEMAKEILNYFSDDYSLRNHDRVLKFVTGGLLFQKGIKGENPYSGINVEDLFNTVQLLADKDNTELGPFIGSWHPLIDKLEGGEISGLESRQFLELIDEPIKNALMLSDDKFSEFANQLNRKLSSPKREHRLRELLEEIVRDVSASQSSELLDDTTRKMIQKLIMMVWIDDASVSRVEHLFPLLKYADKSKAIIATLNYDNTIELAGKALKISVDTGIDEWSNTGNFVFKSGSIKLIKLHGSIDWMRSDGRISQEKPIPFETITRGTPKNLEDINFNPQLLFGGKNKLTAKGPFLSLLKAFETALSESERLTVVGYSFRDDHINEFIGNWINGDSRRILRVVDPGIVKEKNTFLGNFIRPVATNRLVEIRQKASDGILEVTKD